ncbi:Putative methyltransferase [Marinomonas spartinae]|uniref:Putative methyltransferase n=1 Tax=Marinomonas spartinae TaxID=1792290 RepID=A0A1A8TFG5_9GAMM|nr:methyltransferase domain-containing protein [Marinomonas spartinae]SBS32082.1 Putative methyltransferase [Marinomonas spartinae]SBS35537.1 Putative methyltransferase [Marinomonas spartinae]
MSTFRVRYQTLEFDLSDIHVRTLRDNQQFSDDENEALNLGISSATWPLFGIIWPSGEVLAHLMYTHNIDGVRILEVGCGIGLASLVLNHRHANITATDYHPEAGRFLSANVLLNGDRPIPFVRTGWQDGETSLGQYDCIIGSDLLYERSHVDMLADFIDCHAAPDCEVILVDPGRGHHAVFSKKMVSLGYQHSQSKPLETSYLVKPFKGQVLSYHRSKI